MAGHAPSRARGGSEPKKKDVRSRIVDAVLDLIAEGGIGSLTTVAIARAARIHQPNFYAHFKNVDDCLGAAALHVTEQFRLIDTGAFRAVRDAVERGEPHEELSLRYHANLVDLLLREPRFTELFFRHRHESSAFGRALRRLEEETIAGVTAHLMDWAVLAGIRGRYLPEIRLLAEIQVGATATAVLALLEGRATDRAMVARALAENAEATTRATFRRLLEASMKP